MAKAKKTAKVRRGALARWKRSQGPELTAKDGKALLQAMTGEPIKTTIKVPRALWGQVYPRALADGTDMNGVVVAALRAYLGVTS